MTAEHEESEPGSVPLRTLLNRPPEVWPSWARLTWARTFGEHQLTWRELREIGR